MKTAALPADELQRLKALRALDVLGTPPEERFDRITRLVARSFDVPLAFVSLVDDDREWFKSCYGTSVRESARDVSFCGHTILSDEALVVEDTFRDDRFHDNPNVICEDGIRFYAGCPLRSVDGSRVGALCIKDTQPRTFTPKDLDMLRDLAAMVEQELRTYEVALLEQKLQTVSEAERRATEDHRQFFELSLDLLCVAGLDGYFKQLNPAWERVLGYDMRELLAKPFADFVHPDDLEATANAVAVLNEGEDVIAFENRYRCRDGQYRWMHWNATMSEDGQRIYAIARDITELKHAQEVMQQAREYAESASSAKSKFLANMSHELRTPLNSVIGFSSVLLKNSASNLDEKDLSYLERIRLNGMHLLDLINRVLDLSKIEAGRTELSIVDIGLGELVRDVVAQLEGLAQSKGLRLETRVPDGLTTLQSDETHMRQILINLVGNAIKFTEKGTVRVTVYAERVTNRPVRIDISDSGIGIPAAKLNVIFEAFRQADEATTREFQGSGLGLAISHSLCQLMGYSLSVASEEGKGSTFTIWIQSRPAKIGTVRRRLLPGQRTVPAEANGGSESGTASPILVIDDDEDARFLLKDCLEDMGHAVVTAECGVEGLQLARAHQPSLITLDLMMPGMNGWEVLQKIKSTPELTGTPVVVVSIEASENRGTVIGAVDVMDKPVDRDHLREIVTRNLKRPEAYILVIEDDPDFTRIFQDELGPMPYRISYANNGASALGYMAEYVPDLIVLDLMMPVLDGVEFLNRIRADDRYASIPVVVVTAKELTLKEKRELDTLASDVLSKGREIGSGLNNLKTLVADLLSRPA